MERRPTLGDVGVLAGGGGGGLPFVRRDLLGEIVAKGRITNREHYDYATDAVGLAGEEGGPSEEQAAKLKQMIGAYEKRGRK